MENTDTIIKAIEIKSMVAKLMAKENISIQRGNFRTAFFDVNNRVLGLPLFASISEAATDLMIGHEIGHALFTNPEDWNAALKKNPKRKSIINIIEDIRIERKVREEFPGLISVFRNGYKDLLADGFFGKFNVNKLSILDRININAKTGTPVPFTDEEQALYDICLAVDTWEDVLNAVEEVVKFIKANRPKKTEELKKGWDIELPTSKNDSFESYEPAFDPDEEEEEEQEVDLPEEEEEEEFDPTDSDLDEIEDEEEEKEDEEYTSSDDDIDLDEDDSPAAESDESDDSPAKEDDESDNKKDDEEEDDKNEDSEQGGTNWAEHQEPEARQEQEEEEEEFESETMDSFEQNLQDDIASDSFVNVIEPTDDMYKKCIVPYKMVAAARAENADYASDRFTAPYKKFIDNNKKFVSMLKKEFDMKKAAYEYARSTTSRRGTLDVNKLHSYKYDDNIFQQVSRLGNAKSHGMMFMIDMSGSMDTMISEVYKQAMILAMFCKAVGIPFEVYGWTNGEYFDAATDKNVNMINLANLRLTQLITSEMGPKEYKEALFGMFKSASIFEYSSWGVSKYESLAGTPYIEMLTASHYLIRKFKARNNIQNMNLMVLSDGAGGSMSLTGSYGYYRTKYFGKLNGGKVSEIGSGFESQASWMINNLRDTCRCKVITLGLIPSRGSSWGPYSSAVGYDNAREAKAALRKDGIYCNTGHLDADLNIAIKMVGHDLSNEHGFDQVDTEGLTDNQIAQRFIKTVKARKSDRVFVNEFIKIIA